MAQERPAPAPLLEDAFRDPPASARPRVWWHWMNGNITKDGIAKDLAWMKATGIGGVQNFDADLSTPQIVDKRLVYMTPEWKDAFRFAVEEADRLGLEFAIAASPGWSETGGPWVPPQDGMKKLVWSETVIEGGHPFAGKLPRPPQVTGPYQAMPLVEDATFGPPVEKPAPPTYYADTAVVAYRIDDRAAEAPRYTLSRQPIPAAPLTDDDLGTAVDIAAGKGRMIGIDYARAITVRSARLFMPGNVPNFRDPKNGPVLEAQVGGTWRQVGTFRLSDVPTTIGFAPVTARSFRIVLGPFTGEARPSPMGDRAEGMTLPNFFPPADPDAAVKIALLRLDAEDRVDHVEAKAGFTIARAYDTLGNPAAPATGVAAESVVDLTSRMAADGSLDWRPPAGRWRVLRFGYSLTGKTNHPAPAEATGLEVDKMDGAAVRRYLTTYLDRYRDASNGALGQRGIDALLNDSTEVGAFNWTARLPEHFRRLRGYDLTRWLPVLTGAVIGSRAESERFLYDFRRTIADLHATEHYGTVADVAALRGLNRAFVAQGLKVMARRANPGLAALADAARLTRAPTCTDLGFALGPRINAGGRVGRADLGVRLLTTRDPAEARAIAEELDRLNEERRAIEGEVQAAAEAMIREDCSVAVVSGEGWHPGVIGIVAGRLKERLGCPSLVIAIGEDGVGKGSGRSIPGVDLGAAVLAAKEAGLIVAGGGHAAAAGVTVAPGGVPALAVFLEEKLAGNVARAREDRALLLDAVLAPGGVSADLVDAMEAGGPYGMGWPSPRVAAGPVRVIRADRVGNGHVRAIVAGEDGRSLKAMAFRMADTDLGAALLGAPPHRRLWLAGRAKRDDWSGRAVAELHVEDAAWAD
ncbi:MAG TPA: hypothetical protein DEP91_13350 [Sphingomonas bacterium]|uniref:Glycoside hydrolase n=1 Tax=Sphingomonas bacterium TaxID=1895847 RepID=A0A3D0WET1_9SPHN|nr:hypothetical protein [Sphingomonas bacterium]